MLNLLTNAVVVLALLVAYTIGALCAFITAGVYGVAFITIAALVCVWSCHDGRVK
jgi:hypothetical protein